MLRTAVVNHYSQIILILISGHTFLQSLIVVKRVANKRKPIISTFDATKLIAED
jgi:hypothetical protein